MAERQQPGLSTDSPSGYRRGASTKKRNKPARGGDSGGGRMGTSLMMVLLIAGLVLAGWFIANQQQQLAAEQARLSDASKRIEKLEQRLMATDSALTQEGEDTQQAIGFWESEIRKLWAVSNERNKKWIEDNRSGVAKISKTLNGIESANRDLKAAVERHESAFEQQQTLVDQLTSLELQMQQLVRGQRDLVDKVNAANQSVASIKASLTSQVTSAASQSPDGAGVSHKDFSCSLHEQTAS